MGIRESECGMLFKQGNKSCVLVDLVPNNPRIFVEYMKMREQVALLQVSMASLTSVLGTHISRCADRMNMKRDR